MTAYKSSNDSVT